MINLCKHCYSVLGYDNKYSFVKELNKKCSNCKSGLKVTDIISVDDMLVYPIRILYIKFGIRTHYSCEGHLCNKVFSESYLVVDDKPIIRDAIAALEYKYITSRTDVPGKLRLVFDITSVIDMDKSIHNIDSYIRNSVDETHHDVYEYSIAKAKVFNKFYLDLLKLHVEYLI